MSIRKMGICAVDGCGPKLIQARGLCATHYSRLRYHGDPLWEPLAPGRPCAVEGCDAKHYCKSYCVKHYSRWRTHGDVHANPRVYAGPECVAPDCDKEPTGGRYCSVHRARLSPDALVVDHLDEDRANNDRDNLAPSCAPCNFARSSRWKKVRSGGSAQ